ncbi:MAG: hypothetical protein ABEH59_03565 [Halobacteriales archaeon]
MLRQPMPQTGQNTEPKREGPPEPPPSRGVVVTVRNYDHVAAHSVHVTVSDAAGRTVVTERCYLSPGQKRGLTGNITSGEHRIAVRVDGVRRDRLDQELDAARAPAAVIELGNGVVSVTPGPPD